MSVLKRYKSWKEERRDKYYWVSYRLFHRIADRIADKTSYPDVLKGSASDVTARQYISLALLNTFIIGISIVILSNLFAIPGSWITTMINIFNFVISLTSLPLLVEDLASQVVEVVSTVVSVGAEIEFSALLQGLEQSLREIGRDIQVIGALLLAVATAFDSLILPVVESLSEALAESGVSGQQDVQNDVSDLIDTALSLIPPRNQIRLFVMVVVAPVVSILYLVFKLVWPKYVASERGRKIDNNLARSYTFMHALSAGGLGVYEAMSKLAESEDAYGEVSVAFQKIVRNSNKAGGSLSSAIGQVSEETPSSELKDFLNGLTNTIETGSDVNAYVESRAKRALEDAREKQEARLGMYELVSQGYIIIFVAAPIFFIILQLVEAMVGSVNKDVAQMVPYVIIPVGGFLITAIIYLTGQKDNPNFSYLEPELTSKWYDIEVHPNTEKKYQSRVQKVSHRLRALKSAVLTPIGRIKYNPKLTLIFTLPLALITVLIGVELGYVPTSSISAQEANQIQGVSGQVSLMSRIDENHLSFSIFVIYLPFMIIALPWSILYELRRRQREKVLSQLPQLFSSIDEANKRGLTLQEAIETTAMNGDSQLYNKLQEAIRTSEFTRDINGSLIDFANEIRVPRLSQSIRLLVEANRVSSNVTVVVDKIAEDLEAKYALNRDRKQRARIYVVIVFVSFLIGSGVLIALDITFFSFISEEIGSQSSGSSAAPSSQSYGQDLPVTFFRRVFLHSLLALGFVSGIVAGMMENGKPANGLKYAIVMSTLSLIAFVVVPGLVG